MAETSISLWQGESVRLRGFMSSDWEYFARFEEDSEDARSVFRIVPPRSGETHQREVQELASKRTDEDEFSLAVESLVEKWDRGSRLSF